MAKAVFDGVEVNIHSLRQYEMKLAEWVYGHEVTHWIVGEYD